uniref:Uncharacterized protein n=1 Tax=Anguilla anguilla TaxID=7936 RepID=A0A0E9RS94_ANGAN
MFAGGIDIHFHFKCASYLESINAERK